MKVCKQASRSIVGLLQPNWELSFVYYNNNNNNNNNNLELYFGIPFSFFCCILVEFLLHEVCNLGLKVLELGMMGFELELS